jgi:hypothetical protein
MGNQLMKISECLIYIAILTGFGSLGKTDTLPVEAAHIAGVAADLSVYQACHNGEQPNSWQDIATFFGDLNRIDVKTDNGRKFTELYSLVPLSEGSKFTDGTLICVRYEPAKWPSVWSDDPKKEVKDEGDLNRERPIRYLVYKNQRGDILSTWWYEEKIQAMLAKTGLTIPPPTPYYPPTHTPPGEKQVDPSLPMTSVATTKALPSVTPTVTPRPASVAPQSGKTPNSFQWIISAVIALAAVLFIARRKKGK